MNPTPGRVFIQGFCPNLFRPNTQETICMSRMRHTASGMHGKKSTYHDKNPVLFVNGCF
jgi:hypothetical protein